VERRSPIFSGRKVAADVIQLMRKDEGKEIFDKSLHLYNAAEGVGVRRVNLRVKEHFGGERPISSAESSRRNLGGGQTALLVHSPSCSHPLPTDW
jgi:hypothetical protein